MYKQDLLFVLKNHPASFEPLFLFKPAQFTREAFAKFSNKKYRLNNKQIIYGDGIIVNDKDLVLSQFSYITESDIETSID